MKHLPLLFLVLFGFSLQAHAADECIKALLSKPLHALMSEVVQKDLNQPTQSRIRVTGGANAQADYEQMARVLEIHYKVSFKHLSTQATDSGAQIDFEISGPGRDVAQALLEVSNPDVGTSLSAQPVEWITVSNEPPKTELLPIGSARFRELNLKSITDLDFSQRTVNALSDADIEYVGDLLKFSEGELLRIPNLGRKYLNEIKVVFEMLGLQLQTYDPAWPYGDIAIDRLKKLNLTKIQNLLLTERTLRALEYDQIVYIGDLLTYSDERLLQIPGFGRRQLNEVKEFLHAARLKLGSPDSSWPYSEATDSQLNTLVRPGSDRFKRLNVMNVKDLGLSSRTLMALAYDQIFYVGDLLGQSEARLLRIPGFGRISLNEVKEALNGLGLKLGRPDIGWPYDNEEIERLKIVANEENLKSDPETERLKAANAKPGTTRFKQLRVKDLNDLELSVRTTNALRNNNVIYVGDILASTEAELLRIDGFGRRALTEVKEVLHLYGLTLDSPNDGWPYTPEEIARLRALNDEPEKPEPTRGGPIHLR